MSDIKVGETVAALDPLASKAGNQMVVVTLAAVVSASHFSAFAFLPSIFSIGADLNSSTESIQTTIVVYQWLFAISTLLVGVLADRYDRGGLLIVATGVIALGGLGAGLADNFWLFFAWRCVQAVGACMAFVCARAVMADVVERALLVTALAWFSAAASLMAMLAPVIGGWVDQIASWRVTFFLLSFYCLITAVLLYRHILPRTRRVRSLQLLKPETIKASWLPPPIVLRCCLAISVNAFSFHVFVSTASVYLPRAYGYTPAEVGLALMVPSMGFICGLPLPSFLSRHSRAQLDRLVRISLCLLAGLGLLVCLAGVMHLPLAVLLSLMFCVGVVNATVMPIGFAALSMLNIGSIGSVSGFLAFSQFMVAGLGGLLAIPFASIGFAPIGAATALFALGGALLMPTLPGHIRFGSSRP